MVYPEMFYRCLEMTHLAKTSRMDVMLSKHKTEEKGRRTLANYANIFENDLERNTATIKMAVTQISFSYIFICKNTRI